MPEAPSQPRRHLRASGTAARRERRWRSLRAPLVAGAVGATVIVLAACSTAPSGSPAAAATDDGSGPGAPVRVVAAENFWGSLAAQLGGSDVHVASVINNPDADPHDYEPTTADATAMAAAQLAIVNGAGYDAWASKLIAANPVPGRIVLTVGDLVGVPPGGNPHRWYSPDDVRRVLDAVTAHYTKLDPSRAATFQDLHRQVLDVALKDYFGLVQTIRTRYAGTPVGASESIVSPLAQATGLDLVTPPSFLAAISEGTDPTAADKATVDAQLTGRRVKIYIYNRQNATPDVQRQVEEARAAGIPIVTVTETLTPAGASFQDWQTAQLRAIVTALRQATGR
jgi:zinc/manganese transport system substrate-binding protein